MTSIEWYRVYHGMPEDAKLKVIAKRSQQLMTHVVTVWLCVLDAASRHKTRGTVEVDSVLTSGTGAAARNSSRWCREASMNAGIFPATTGRQIRNPCTCGANSGSRDGSSVLASTRRPASRAEMAASACGSSGAIAGLARNCSRSIRSCCWCKSNTNSCNISNSANSNASKSTNSNSYTGNHYGESIINT